MFQTTNKIMNTKQSLISQRIKDNYHDELQKLYSYDILYDIDGILIEVNLERAVIDKAEEFRAMMATILNFEHKHYILDLSSARFMDSTFLGSIVMILKKINSAGSSLSIILDYNRIKILAPFNQLKNILKIYNSPVEAIDVIKKNDILQANQI